MLDNRPLTADEDALALSIRRDRHPNRPLGRSTSSIPPHRAHMHPQTAVGKLMRGANYAGQEPLRPP